MKTPTPFASTAGDHFLLQSKERCGASWSRSPPVMLLMKVTRLGPCHASVSFVFIYGQYIVQQQTFAEAAKTPEAFRSACIITHRYTSCSTSPELPGPQSIFLFQFRARVFHNIYRIIWYFPLNRFPPSRFVIILLFVPRLFYCYTDYYYYYYFNLKVQAFSGPVVARVNALQKCSTPFFPLDIIDKIQ